MVSDWSNIEIPESYHVGDIVSGRITEIHHFGAFLELEPRVFALLLIPEISWSRIRHPSDVLVIGQKISVKILIVNRDYNVISVSQKACDSESDPRRIHQRNLSDGKPVYVGLLSEALREELKGAQVEFENVSADRYRFAVVWDKFDAMDHPERQHLVWSIVDRLLDREELFKITMIMTMGLEDLPPDEE